MSLDPIREAVVMGGLGADLETVKSYLPENYRAMQDSSTSPIRIIGRDSHGWTLDGYVIPRLQSALIAARELVAQ